VVHAVGPIWHGGGDQEETKLEKAVLNSLKKAEELQARSVALPAISSGIFGAPATQHFFFTRWPPRPRAHRDTICGAHTTAHDTTHDTRLSLAGFPKERCAEIMVQTTTDFYHQQKLTHLKDVRSVP
jgi:O-acetyl-ADP-ribose deacetylase (regulator of RNase III)